METDTTALLTALATNVDQGFEAFMSRYQDQLSSWVWYWVGRQEEAEDIVQETFLQAYYALKRYPPEQIRGLALRPWLYKIARHVWSHHLRASRLHQVSLEELEGTLAVEDEEDHAGQPELLLEELETRLELETLLSQLPLPYRETIALYYFEQFSYQEIAYLLNRPMGTVKSHLHRGIQLLRRASSLCAGEARSIHGTHAPS